MPDSYVCPRLVPSARLKGINFLLGPLHSLSLLLTLASALFSVTGVGGRAMRFSVQKRGRPVDEEEVE